MKYRRVILPDAGEYVELSDGTGETMLSLKMAFRPEQVLEARYRLMIWHWIMFARASIRGYRKTADYEKNHQPKPNIINVTGVPKKRWQH